MPLGTVKRVLVCGEGDPVRSGTRSVLCSDGSVVGSVEVYVIDASQAAAFEASAGAFDYSYASQVWTFGFSMVVGLYLVAKKCGLILEFIRRG